MFDVLSELRGLGEEIPQAPLLESANSLKTIVAVALSERIGASNDTSNAALRLISAYQKLNTSSSVASGRDLIERRDNAAQQVDDIEAMIIEYERQMDAAHNSRAQVSVGLEEQRLTGQLDDNAITRIADVADMALVRTLNEINEELRLKKSELSLMKTELSKLSRSIKDKGVANAERLSVLIDATLASRPDITFNDDPELSTLSSADGDKLSSSIRSILMRDFGMGMPENAPDVEPLMKLTNLQNEMTNESKFVGRLEKLISLNLEVTLSASEMLNSLRKEEPDIESLYHDEIKDVNMMIEANINPLGWRASFGKPFSGLVKRMISTWISTGKQRLSFGKLYSLFVPVTHEIMRSYVPTQTEEEPKAQNPRVKRDHEAALEQEEDSTFGNDGM
jgi:hypothetical protein